MFERRLRLFLILLFVGGLILVARAAQVQIAQHESWSQQAVRGAERVAYLAPRRGDILDVKGRIIATDVPAFEACVNYRAIPDEPDAAWLAAEARRRAQKVSGYRQAPPAERAAMEAAEVAGIRADLDALWSTLARLSSQDRSAVDEVRREITAEVERKHASYWRSLFRAASDEFASMPPQPWYERWIAGDRRAPTEADYQARPIGEQLAFHPILGDVNQAVYNELKLAQERLPQFRGENREWQSILQLRPAVRRSYPLGDVACHLIGHVGPVSRDDRANDPDKDDPARRYALVDRIGRDGLEKLAERLLRGTRGTRRTDRRGGHLGTEESTPGDAVRTTIDVALQADIQKAFESVDFVGPDKDARGHPIVDQLSMNGAAVVIDVATGEVRALVSVPTFDLNRFDELYPTLIADDLNRPTDNRALSHAMEPGSTVKPIVGLAAVTQGFLTAHDPIECNGRAVIDGRQIGKPRCWTLSMYNSVHHQVPWAAPHPTGHLTLADAVERSCNVYFVTEGARLGIEGLSYWMRQFGLGRTTGIGLYESAGQVPAMARIAPGDRASDAWYASIGQGKLLATPIQVANEMATIARDGIWMRPRLVNAASRVPLPTTRPDGSTIEDRVDLKLDREAMRAVRDGMMRVVNSPAGTGTKVRSDVVKVAAKTGSATASPRTRPLRGPDGQQLRDANGRLRFEIVPYGTRAQPNPELPWYRLSGYDDNGRAKGTHSWVGGFVPADRPQVAFAVYVEYGNSGGVAAASVVRKLVDACIRHGYVTPTGGAMPTPPGELLRTVQPDEPVNTED